MSTEQILEKLTEIFKDVFDDDTVIINQNTTPQDIDGWDSLQHITLLSAIGDEFDCSFSLDQMIEIQSVADMISALKEL